MAVEIAGVDQGDFAALILTAMVCHGARCR
jgi:hypothetical protein